MFKRKFIPFWAVMIVVIYVCGSSSAQSLVALAISTPKAELANGDTFFPLGFMGAPEEGRFPQIAAGGFNVVHEFRSIQEINAAEDYLNQAETAGLQVIQNMPACRAYDAGFPICEGYSIWSEQEWGEFISTLATHENLVAWYLPDEIDDYLAAANLYEWAHRYDPDDRPVFGNPGTYQQAILDLFPAFTDFLWAACYPEWEGLPRALVTYAMERDANACRGTGTRWGGILQFFDSADLGGSGGYPTAHEIRCDSYQAVIGGATGLWYYSYAWGQDLTELLAGIETVADEIVGTGGLDEVILSPEVSQTVTKTIISGPTQSPVVEGKVYDSIQMLQKMHWGIYLFAVNIATDTVVVEFGNLGAGTDTVEVLFEGRTIPITDDSFSDTFAQDDVHIYSYAVPFASLTISKTDSPDPVTVRNTLTYTLVYTNNGPSDAQGVTLTDTLPPEVTFGGVASVMPSLFGPTQTGQHLTWYTPTLAAGASGTIVFTVTVDAAASGTITNSVVIASGTLDDSPDNNDDEPTLVATTAGLTNIHTDSPDPVIVGNALAYTIVVTNNGPSVATGVTLTDMLPAGVTFGSATPSQGSCSGTSTVTCDLGTLASGATATLTIVVTPTVVGTVVNTASVTGNEADPNMADNTATEHTTVHVPIYLPLIVKDCDT